MRNSLGFLYAAWLMAWLVVLTLFASHAYAEGRCPPGYFPIGGQGVLGCAPMPSGESPVSPPTPSGRWQLTWGAQAASDNGVSFAVTGRKSKSAANRDAVSGCRARGGQGCVSVFSYKNQCFVIAALAPGNPDIYALGPSVESAADFAQQKCSERGSSECRIISSGCTDPIYIKY